MQLGESEFRMHLRSTVVRAGREVIEKALWLYYGLQNPETPAWAKRTIVSALVYFGLPADAVPDVIPVAGYVDDLLVLTTAAATVAMYITDEVKARAAATLSRWFTAI